MCLIFFLQVLGVGNHLSLKPIKGKYFLSKMEIISTWKHRHTNNSKYVKISLYTIYVFQIICVHKCWMIYEIYYRERERGGGFHDISSLEFKFMIQKKNNPLER